MNYHLFRITNSKYKELKTITNLYNKIRMKLLTIEIFLTRGYIIVVYNNNLKTNYYKSFIKPKNLFYSLKINKFKFIYLSFLAQREPKNSIEKLAL